VGVIESGEANSRYNGIMIIFGEKGNEMTLGRVDRRYCPTCEKERDFYISLIYRYGHVFWIPLFSYSTKYFYHCSVCGYGTELKGRDLNPYLTSNPKPWMHRFGWVVVLGIIVILIAIFS